MCSNAGSLQIRSTYCKTFCHRLPLSSLPSSSPSLPSSSSPLSSSSSTSPSLAMAHTLARTDGVRHHHHQHRGTKVGQVLLGTRGGLLRPQATMPRRLCHTSAVARVGAGAALLHSGAKAGQALIGTRVGLLRPQAKVSRARRTAVWREAWPDRTYVCIGSFSAC